MEFIILMINISLLQRALASEGWMKYHDAPGTAEAVRQATEMLRAKGVMQDTPNRLMIPLL